MSSSGSVHETEENGSSSGRHGAARVGEAPDAMGELLQSNLDLHRRNGELMRRVAALEAVAREVHEARRAALNLLEDVVEAEGKYRTLFNSIDEGFCILEKLKTAPGQPTDFRYLVANPKLAEISGVPDMVGRSIQEISPEEPVERIEIYETVLRSGEPRRFEQELPGRGLILDLSVSRVEDGTSSRVAVVFDDITERKRLQANLVFLAETSSDFAPLSSPEEIMHRVGERLGRYLNLSRCDFSLVHEKANRIATIYAWRRDGDMPAVLGEHPISLFLTETDRQKLDAGKVSVIDDAQHHSLTKVRLEMLAELRIGSVVDAPYLENKRWRFLLSASRSETSRWRPDEIELIRELAARVYIRVERARAESALRESEEHLRAVINQTLGGIAEVDLAGRYTQVNDRYCEIVGYTREELLNGMFLQDITHREDLPRNNELLKRLRETCQPFEIVKRYVRKDGSAVWVHNSVAAILNAACKPQTVVAIVVDITEGRRAEEALRESEARFRAMFEQAHVGIVQIAADSHFLAVNPGASALLGYSGEELLRMGVKDVTHPEDMPREEELTARLLVGEIADYTYEKRFVCQDGRTLWGTMTATLVRDSAGQALYVLAILEATEERKRAEEQLRESEERFRQFAENSSDVFWILDAKTRQLEYVNPVYEEIFGQPRAALMKDSARRLDLVPAEDQEEAGTGLVQALGGETFVRNYRIVRPSDGETRWIRDTGFPIRDENGAVVRVAGVAQDVTDDKERTEALRESEERFRLLVEGAPEYAMFLMDSSNHIIYWSTGAQRVFGWSADEVLGQTAEIIFTPEDRADEAVEKEMAVARKNGSAPDRRWHVRKDGSRIWVDGIMHRLDDESGEIRGYAKIARDATETRAAEEELLRAHDELEQRVRERTSELQRINNTLETEMAQRQFLEQEILRVTERERARIGQDLHDSLCQELTATAFLLKSRSKAFLREDPEAAEALVEAAETVNANAGLARDLARGLHPFELSGGLPSALRELCARMQEKIQCGCNAPRTLRLEENIAVNLYRIAQEAVTNASKHAKPSEIDICLSREGRSVLLSVRDNGKAKAAKINAGMGIHMMKYRANAIGGTLKVESAPGKGTKVICQVPLEK